MCRGLVPLVAALVLAGCTGGQPSVGKPSVSTRHVAATQHYSPQQQAERDAQELLTHVRVPPSATATRTPPNSRLTRRIRSRRDVAGRPSPVMASGDECRRGGSVASQPSPSRFHVVAERLGGGGPAFQVVQFAYEPRQRRADGTLRQLQVEVTNLDESSSGIARTPSPSGSTRGRYGTRPPGGGCTSASTPHARSRLAARWRNQYRQRPCEGTAACSDADWRPRLRVRRPQCEARVPAESGPSPHRPAGAAFGQRRARDPPQPSCRPFWQLPGRRHVSRDRRAEVRRRSHVISGRHCVAAPT